ncbi:hypothetical protein APR11_004443 [Nocardia amikacinitolerans]|nr:hypothetical protein [Nocardia amikacinitolerans]MCP2298002.1 hypothetical protein [Nocardia amikacinitolerans]
MNDILALTRAVLIGDTGPWAPSTKSSMAVASSTTRSNDTSEGVS